MNSRSSENFDSNLYRSPNNDSKNTETQCESILNKEEINFKVDKIASVSSKIPHKQRLVKLRNLLPELEATNWMYTPISELIGCSARQQSTTAQT